MTHAKLHREVPVIGEALAYGREDMNRLMREVLATEGIRNYHGNINKHFTVES